MKNDFYFDSDSSTCRRRMFCSCCFVLVQPNLFPNACFLLSESLCLTIWTWCILMKPYNPCSCKGTPLCRPSNSSGLLLFPACTCRRTSSATIAATALACPATIAAAPWSLVSGVSNAASVPPRADRSLPVESQAIICR